MNSRTIYLTSYDLYNEILRYELPGGEFAIIGRAEMEQAGIKPAFGDFTREGDTVAGVFASPQGPMVFVNGRCFMARFGRTTARVEAAGAPRRLRFTLEHDDPPAPTETLTVTYTERLGLGANPYDNEEEDIDLFARIASGLRSEAFFRAYTRLW